MSRTYRAWDVDQVWLLPPSIHDFVPASHPAHLVRELVRRELELLAIFAPCEREERGQPPYHPALMVAEDAELGPEMRADELPDRVADHQARLERIRAAKAALEAEAKADPPPAAAEPDPSSGMVDHGQPARAPGGGPPDRAQRNFADPDSRVLKTRDGFIQGYNGQLAVDAAHQIITAQRLTTNGSDQAGLAPLLDATTAALGRRPRELARGPGPTSVVGPVQRAAAAGFCREGNLDALAARGIRGYLAPGRASHGGGGPSGQRQIKPGSRMAGMAARLKRAGRRSRYRLRKQTVEPARRFAPTSAVGAGSEARGQIKHARGFRQFLLRGSARSKPSGQRSAPPIT